MMFIMQGFDGQPGVNGIDGRPGEPGPAGLPVSKVQKYLARVY